MLMLNGDNHSEIRFLCCIRDNSQKGYLHLWESLDILIPNLMDIRIDKKHLIKYCENQRTRPLHF
jgi:hypothetical protein